MKKFYYWILHEHNSRWLVELLRRVCRWREEAQVLHRPGPAQLRQHQNRLTGYSNVQIVNVVFKMLKGFNIDWSSFRREIISKYACQGLCISVCLIWRLARCECLSLLWRFILKISCAISLKVIYQNCVQNQRWQDCCDRRRGRTTPRPPGLQRGQPPGHHEAAGRPGPGRDLLRGPPPRRRGQVPQAVRVEDAPHCTWTQTGGQLLFWYGLFIPVFIIFPMI